MTLDGTARPDNETDPESGIAARGPGRRIKRTSSICPQCLTTVDAEVFERHGEVWMDKRCPAHGAFSALLASDIRHYHEKAVTLKSGGSCCGGGCDPAAASAALDPGRQWTNHSCTVLIEITERCNLSCPTCFAGSSPQHSKMMSLDTFSERVDGLVAGGKQQSDMIQLSGGEPTVHPQIFEMVDLLFARGFGKVCINSNGIKLAQPQFVERLTRAMQSHPDGQLFVYLQFDGFDDATHARLRGRADLLEIKRRALANCVTAGIRVHPVMTLTREINDHEVGDFLRLTIDNPVLKHVVIQPAMYSGRYDNPRRADRLTLADTVQLICEQFGVFTPADFGPIPCSDPNCYGIAVALRSSDGLLPISRYFPRHEDWEGDEARDLITAFSDTLDGASAFGAAVRWATSGQRQGVFDDLDDKEVDRLLSAFIELQSGEGRPWDRMVAVSIKPFMDALTYDQDRIDQCCVHILDDHGDPVSFCEFNAVNRPRMMGQGSSNV